MLKSQDHSPKVPFTIFQYGFRRIDLLSSSQISQPVTNTKTIGRLEIKITKTPVVVDGNVSLGDYESIPCVDTKIICRLLPPKVSNFGI
ncbi:MAG: hypothetical protein WAV41_00735 [Microgenomates group bacterium]